MAFTDQNGELIKFPGQIVYRIITYPHLSERGYLDLYAGRMAAWMLNFRGSRMKITPNTMQNFFIRLS